MSRESDRDSLLRDVLAEGASSGTRELWLSESMRMSRRRRVQVRTRAAIATLAVAAVSALLALRLAPKRLIESLPVQGSVMLISTQPLAGNALVATRPLDAGHFVLSAVNATVILTSRNEFRTISDSELLAFVLPRAAILVRADRGSERLVFVNPEDKGTFYSDRL
jgi:hypothetical protein